MKRRFSDSEVAEFFGAHFAHRLTALLCVAKRSEESGFWQGRGDVYCASIEGSFIMFRMFVEFLGLESYRLASGEHDLHRRSLKKRKETDVMLDNFGLSLAQPDDFAPHRALVGRVHDGVSKATAHLTYEANDFLTQVETICQHSRSWFASSTSAFTSLSVETLSFIPICSSSMNASNQSLQPTALWRCASMSILISVSSTVAQPRSQSGG
jgi:hypothetical protein